MLWLILISLAIGGIIAVLNNDSINNTSEKLESWSRRSYQNTLRSDGWFRMLIIRPVLWLVIKLSDWTDTFPHRGLKNGVRVALTLLTTLLWFYLVLAAFMFVVAIAVGLLILYVILKVMINSKSDFKRGYNISKGIIGSGGHSTRVDPNTGIIQKEGLFGWVDTDRRVNPESGNYQEEGLLGWNDTGRRVNQQTGVVQEEGLFGYNDTDTRIDPETGIIQKEGLLGWVDTDRRVNPDTGKHQTNGIFGWHDD